MSNPPFPGGYDPLSAEVFGNDLQRISRKITHEPPTVLIQTLGTAQSTAMA